MDDQCDASLARLVHYDDADLTIARAVNQSPVDSYFLDRLAIAIRLDLAPVNAY